MPTKTLVLQMVQLIQEEQIKKMQRPAAGRSIRVYGESLF